MIMMITVLLLNFGGRKKLVFDDFDTFCIIDKVPDENELYKIVEFVCSNGKNIICVEEEYLDQIEKFARGTM